MPRWRPKKKPLKSHRPSPVPRPRRSILPRRQRAPRKSKNPPTWKRTWPANPWQRRRRHARNGRVVGGAAGAAAVAAAKRNRAATRAHAEHAARLAAVVIVRVDDEPVVIADGLKPAVAADGSPDALRATLPVNPPVRVRLTVYVVPAPAVTVLAAGLTPSEKSGVTELCTTNVAGTECEVPPPVPVMVIG